MGKVHLQTPLQRGEVHTLSAVVFPLFSLLPLVLVISGASELYAAIAVLNAVLLLVLTFDTTDFTLGFIGFEISLITGFTALSLESRSYRRLYAFFVMIACTLISSAAMYALLASSREAHQSSGVVVAVASLLLLVKTPCFPFSVGLPEAHVEASGPGSVVLAGYALKFSVLALTAFVAPILVRQDFVFAMLLFSLAFSTAAMCATVDTKKMIANFSVVHMCVTVALLSAPQNSEGLLNFSGHHHSIITGGIFVMIGWVYATTSSRLFRLLLGSSDHLPVFTALLFAMLTFSLDLPWTSNFLVEVHFFRTMQTLTLLLPLFCLFFGVVIIAYLILSSSRTHRGFLSDYSTVGSSTLFVTTLSAVILGYGILREVQNGKKPGPDWVPTQSKFEWCSQKATF